MQHYPPVGQQCVMAPAKGVAVSQTTNGKKKLTTKAINVLFPLHRQRYHCTVFDLEIYSFTRREQYRMKTNQTHLHPTHLRHKNGRRYLMLVWCQCYMVPSKNQTSVKAHRGSLFLCTWHSIFTSARRSTSTQNIVTQVRYKTRTLRSAHTCRMHQSSVERRGLSTA